MAAAAAIALLSCAATAVTAGPAGAAAVSGARQQAAAAPTSYPVTSAFDFCNNTGGSTIACFTADLSFNSARKFTLSNIVLTDRNCDNRSALATVTDQQSIWEEGTLGGLPYTFKNSLGCNKSEGWGSWTFTATHNINYVVIKLFSANDTGHSSVVSSSTHHNPY